MSRADKWLAALIALVVIASTTAALLGRWRPALLPPRCVGYAAPWCALLLLLACSTGDPFEHGSQPGSGLASAQSGAGATAAGQSPELGGAAGAAAGAGGEGGDGPAGAPGGPCEPSTWSPTAFATAEGSSAAQAVDRAPATAWSSGKPREPGQWFRLDLAEPGDLAELELDTSAPELLLELDGAPVSVARSWPRPGVLLLQFEATPASSARLVVPPASSAPEPWSIAELRAVCR